MTDWIQYAVQLVLAHPVAGVAFLAISALLVIIRWYVHAYASERGRLRAIGSTPPTPSAGPKAHQAGEQDTSSTPGIRVIFSDDVVALVELVVAIRIVDPNKALDAGVQTPSEAWEAAKPSALARIHQVLEGFSSRGIRAERPEAESRIADSLESLFATYGVLVGEVSLGSITPVARIPTLSDANQDTV